MPSDKDHENSINTEIRLNKPGEFQIIYERYYLNVFRFIFGLYGGPLEDVEDLTVNTFTRAWKSRNRFHGNINSVQGWLLKIARNLVIDQFRSMKNKQYPVDIEQQNIPSVGLEPEELIHRKEQYEVLMGLLSEISDEHREIIILRYFLNWRVKAIAEHLGKSENNISVTIRRILSRIQSQWPRE